MSGVTVCFERYGEATRRHYEVQAWRSPRHGQVTALFRDVTERKQAEEAVRESEARFHALADAMPQLIWTAQPDGTVDYYNQRQSSRGFAAMVSAGSGHPLSTRTMLHAPSWTASRRPGAKGYIAKGGPPEALFTAIRADSQG